MSALEVTGLFQDARQVIPGSVFVAVRGQKFDGHDFLSQACSQGASALVVEDQSKVSSEYSGFVLQVPDSRQALGTLASRFYWDPGQELFCVGVTGTNGKTSITYMVEAILNQVGHKTAVMGTVNHHLGENVWPSEMTTPDPISLQQRLREFRKMGATAAALEVSSHALDQRRTDSVPFDVVVFSNLTRDHLDYHKNMQNYFLAKQRLFTDLMAQSAKYPRFAVVNLADSWGRKMAVATTAEVITYGTKDADFHCEILEVEFSFTRFRLSTPWSRSEVKLPMAGLHNVQNSMAALAVGAATGASWDSLLRGLQEFRGVPGRLQTVVNPQGRHVLVDYAHSPDALDNVLRALQGIRRGKKSEQKIWVVFGCGGDRDKGKRPLMAQSALQGADHVVLTSDNPRTEAPQAIIDDVMQGVSRADRPKVKVCLDRAQAIQETIVAAKQEDVILIAGKGHEDYQIVGQEKKPFSDYDVAFRVLQELA